MRYRRATVAGAAYFFTVNLADRQSALLTEYITDLRHAIRRIKHAHPFRIDAWVVLPDHLHMIWTLPPDDMDFATRWMLIKATFSRAMPAGEKRSASRITKGERGIWQRRYWEHLIRDEDDLARHVDYIHINPVKHGLATRAADWAHSSIHRHVRLGMINADWAGVITVNGDFGE